MDDSRAEGLVVLIIICFIVIVVTAIAAANMFEDWTEMRKYEMCVAKSPDPVKCSEGKQ